jgi:hypothetical protein
MPEFKIEPDALSEKREAKGRLLSWGIVLLSFAMTALIFILGFRGLLSVGSDLHWLGWLLIPSSLGAVMGASILSIRGALRRAEREMVFVLDDNGIVRKRKGFPEVRIAFSDVDTLGEELRWLVVRSANPRRKIAIPNNVQGYEVIRAELTKHHALAAPVKKLPLRSAAPGIILVLSWVAVLSFHDVKLVIPAALIAMMLLALASRRMWIVMRGGQRRPLSLFCIGTAWFMAILLIYLRIVQR